MLELINVCYSAENDGIKKDIIKDVSLKLDEKFIAFTGPNGGGFAAQAVNGEVLKRIFGGFLLLLSVVQFFSEEITEFLARH